MAIRYREPDAGAGVIDLDSEAATGGSRQILVDANARNRFGAGYTTRGSLVSASGNTTVIDPAPGKFVRLHWLGLWAPYSNADETLVIAKFGAVEHYHIPLGPGGAFSHWQVIDGAVDENFVLNLSAAYAVRVNVTWEEL